MHRQCGYCAYYFSTGRAHDGPKFTNTITLKKYNFHYISISQHLQKNSTKENYKDTSQNELTNKTPKWRHKKTITAQENNEYLVQQQNRVQYRTISKYKTHDKMEKTSENNNINKQRTCQKWPSYAQPENIRWVRCTQQARSMHRCNASRTTSTKYAQSKIKRQDVQCAQSSMRHSRTWQ